MTEKGGSESKAVRMYGTHQERKEAGRRARRVQDRAAERQMQLLDHRHIWVEEQQTGHKVCAWCGYCEGGCS